jgi:hypothetical protein
MSEYLMSECLMGVGLFQSEAYLPNVYQKKIYQ